MFIERDGKVYELVEHEVDVAQEEYKLQAWKDAIVSDQMAIAEHQTKIAEVENLKISADLKEKIKEVTILHSGTGITQEMVDAQQAKVDEIRMAQKM